MSKLRPWDETIGARFFSTDEKAEGAGEEAGEENGEGEEAAEEGDELTRLRTELEEKDAKVADLTDKILRTMAEMENLRERTRRQAEDAKKFAIQGFCKDLLDVADNLDRAIATVGEE
jgi:molecular chaperone GrpE